MESQVGELRGIDISRREITARKAFMLIVVVVLARLVYSIWLSPVQLAGDEAYYWEQARHLDLCYNEKGPALAWMMAPLLWVFGDHEWVVRLPVLISFFISGWAIIQFTLRITKNDARAAFYAVALFCLIPAFEANAQICTQDGPIITIWIALTAIGLRLFERWREGKNVWAEWMAFWVVMGVGFLFKQSILLFLPSLVIYWWLRRREMRMGIAFFAQQLVGAMIFFALISPMIIWNAQHGWPMMAHTVGHLSGGGDQAHIVQKGNALLWLGQTLGGIVGAVGPALLLMWWASRAGWKDAQRQWLVCAAVPSILFFVLLSFIKPVVPSWPLPSFAPLVILAGELIANNFGKKPETAAVKTWKIMLYYGVIAALLLAFPNVLGVVPKIKKSMVARISGHREEAMKIEKVLAEVKASTSQEPIIVTRHYMKACLLSFYMPEHPVVHTAGKYLGKRSTTLDQWSDTRLDQPSLYGRNLLLIDDGDVKWEQALKFDAKLETSRRHTWVAVNYQGPKADHPSLDGHSEEE